MLAQMEQALLDQNGGKPFSKAQQTFLATKHSELIAMFPGYDEIGMDVTLTRLGSDPVVLGLDRRGLLTGSARPPGANLPD